MTEKEFLERYDNNDDLSGVEIASLIHRFPRVKTIVGRSTEICRERGVIISAGGRCFLINWYEGLGCFKGDDFYCSPIEVKRI